MNVSYRLDKEILYVSLEGRVDAGNAPLAEEKVFAILSEHPEKHLVVDADLLEYLSSAGLRLVLKMRKEKPKLAIINVDAAVYQVLEMTGFTDMITVEKAYPRMDVEGCEFIAKGCNGAVYRYDDETIVKTYFAKDSLPEIKQERENARKAFVLGINTAIPYGIVRVGEGYGTVTELLNAVSVTKLICAHPENLSEALGHYVEMLKCVHSTEGEEGDLPDMKQIALSWAEYVGEHLPKEQGEKLRKLIQEVPKQNTILHGDYNTNNVMVQNNEPLLIDLDTLCMGHPVFELGSIFNSLVGFSELDPQNNMRFYGYSLETARRFLEEAFSRYLGTEDPDLCQSVMEKAMIIGYTRMLRRALRRPKEEDSPVKIARCKEMLGRLLQRVDTLVF